MANTIIFSSAYLRTGSFALDEGAKRIRLNFTSSLTKEVRDKMEWAEPLRPKGNGRTLDEAAKKIDLAGEINARQMTMTPNDKEWKKHAFSIDIATVDSFQLVTVDGENSTRRELRFQVITTAAEALSTVERFTDAAGQAKCELKISYVKQDLLPGVDPDSEGQQELDEMVQDAKRKRATSAEAD